MNNYVKYDIIRFVGIGDEWGDGRFFWNCIVRRSFLRWCIKEGNSEILLVNV